ncbi:hypothetical protein BDV98DRAFT_568241, partial [Pterulicium gracile]
MLLPCAHAPVRCSPSLLKAASRHPLAIRCYSDAVPKEGGKRLKRVVFSGIQPTGTPHLGNYLGALSNWVKLQNSAAPEDDLLFSIVGWHALTLPQDPKELSASRMDMLAVLLAIGLNPERSVIFHQEDNLHHTELAWLLNCITPIGKLRRMTTWKQSRLAVARNANDESEVDESLLNAGLLTYPVLQAADVLAYKATEVPVGEDQQQHLELARDIADSFNRTFKRKHPMFPLPRPVITPSRRVLSLRDPSAKMSKSAPDSSSRIMLTDTSTQISKKIKSAVTDSTTGISYDPINRPGISNLLTIVSSCTEQSMEDVCAQYKDFGHGEFKEVVIGVVEGLFRGPREEYARIRGDERHLVEVARKGAEKARARSEVTMREVRERVGLA